MNLVFYKSCQICESKYLIKHQAGIRSTEFFFECPECGIMLSGNLLVDKGTAAIDSIFNNLSDFDSKNPEDFDFFIQLSGEFYDNKLKKYEMSDRFMPGSFMQSINPQIEKMGSMSRYLCEDMFDRYNEVEIVIELILNNKKNTKYVYSEIQKLSQDVKNFIKCSKDEKYFFENFNSEKYDILFLSIVYVFLGILDCNSEKFDFECFGDVLREVLKKSEHVHTLKSEFGSDLNELLKSLSIKLFDYVKILKKINPVVSSETFNVFKISDIREEKGLNTVDYKELLRNYADCFEIVGKILPIYVAIDNLYKRSDIDCFVSEEYNSIENFKKATIGKKLEYMRMIEYPNLEYMDFSILKNKVRNSINHYSFEYDSTTQLLSFNDRGREIDLYLIEFAYENYLLFYLIFECFYIICSLLKRVESS